MGQISRTHPRRDTNARPAFHPRRSLPRRVVLLPLLLLAAAGFPSHPSAGSAAGPAASPPGPTRTRSPGSPEVRALLDAAKYPQAERKVRLLLRRAEPATARDSLAFAELLDQLTEALRREGRSGEPEAMQTCQRAMGIKERLVGARDPRYAASLFQLGYLYYRNGHFALARGVFERTLAIQEAALGKEDLDVAATLLLLAGVLSDEGDSAAAKPLLERSLAIRTASLGPDSPGTAECLNASAALATRLGDFSGAIPLHERALRIWRKCGRRDQIGTSLANLAAVLHDMGDYEGALSFGRKALVLRRETLGPRHEFVADALSGIGIDLAALGRIPEARVYLRRALAIEERRFGASSAEAGWTLGRMGMVDLQAGDYGAARSRLRRATELLGKGRGEDNQDFAEALAALATATAALGDSAAARAMYEHALRIQTASLGPGHPDVGLMLTQYARLLATTGEDSLALETALQGEEISREHLRLTSRSLPERQALEYAARRPAGGRVALSIMAGNRAFPAGAVPRVWDSLIRGRTLVLDEMASRNRAAAESGDRESMRLTEDLAGARRLLANLLVAGPGEDPPERYRESVARARSAAELAERRLAGKSAAFRTDQARDRIGLAEVVSSLPHGGALVAYAAAGDSANRSYVAFVLSGDPPTPACVPIGRASRVETCVSRWLADMSHAAATRATRPSEAESLGRVSGAALRRLVWDPVVPRLGGAARVYIVPDGAIHLVNFAALPVGRDRYLVEQGFVPHYLSAERDLVPRAERATAGSGLLVLGEPAFDFAAGEAPGGSAAVVHRSAVSDCPSFRSLRFAPLPGTGREARDVAAIWGTRSPTTMLLGPAATEAAFKADAPGRSVVHLATHGFFLGDLTRVATGGSSRGIGGIGPGAAPAPGPRPCAASPLLLSGLAFAGANQRASAKSRDEDGILTAEEVSAINLSGVDWVVLSACDTGKGRIQAGEGVLGLQRAFQIAGARAVIMSLWPVEDESAGQWMNALYRARISEGLDAADAAAKADLTVLRGRRAQARSADPFYWAAFVATGDWK